MRPLNAWKGARLRVKAIALRSGRGRAEEMCHLIRWITCFRAETPALTALPCAGPAVCFGPLSGRSKHSQSHQPRPTFGSTARTANADHGLRSAATWPWAGSLSRKDRRFEAAAWKRCTSKKRESLLPPGASSFTSVPINTRCHSRPYKTSSISRSRSIQ